MKAVSVHQFGGPEAIVYEDLPQPVPSPGQVLVRVEAAGVGPWDAWVRAGKSVLPQPLPLTPGADLSGVVQDVGWGVARWRPGDEIYGVTNAQFTGACAEYALVDAAMIASKPALLDFVEAASVPVVASMAWQMLFDHGKVDSTKRVLVHGGAGSVGAFAVQLANMAGAQVIATVRGHDTEYARSLGADQVIDVQTAPFEEQVADVDVVIDTVGGETLDRSFQVLRHGGMVVSAVANPDPDKAARYGVRAVFFLVAVKSVGLEKLAALFDSGRLTTHVGEVLPLADARLAHEMLGGTPHKRGKIVLAVRA